MPDYIFPPQNTPSQLTAQSPKALPQLWARGAELGEQEEDFFQEFEGKSAMSPIRTKTELSADEGMTITFRTHEGLYEDGVMGDELIENAVELWEVGDYDLTVDYVRHATRWDKRTEDATAMHTELSNHVNVNLGKWLGRKKMRSLQMLFIHKLHPTSQIILSSDGTPHGSVDDLRSGDTLTMDGITSCGQIMKTNGAEPALVGRSGKDPILRFITVATGEGLVSLQNSSDYKQAQRDAGIRGADNVIFKGGYSDVNGHVIREYQPKDHGGAGPIGSPLNPKAALGVAITATDASQTIYGGGTSARAAKTRVMYFESFGNYAFRFTSGDVLTVDMTPRYCLIYNVSGAAAGKMGFYQFIVNNGNNLVMVARLRAAAAGISVTTLGGVTWNTGSWLNRHTDSHPEGSIIVETNAYGVPIGRSFMLGAQGALRGYGRYRNERSEQLRDGGFVKDVYITSVFGQTPKIRTDKHTPNALCITHAISYAGLSIPAVL